MPKRGDTATCAECGQPITWEYTHGEWGWKCIYPGFGTSKYCFPFLSWSITHHA